MAPPDPPIEMIDLTSSEDEDDDSSSVAPSEDGESTTVRSPSKLLYDISSLPREKQAFIRDVFNEPPQIALQQCRRIDGTYAFQMTELITRSIRIHDQEDGSSPMSCSCKEKDDEPCSHTVWLLDQLAKQTLYDHEPAQPLVMSEDGCVSELGDPFKAIATHHLDVLAAGLHCQVIDPSTENVDSTRATEARELLASVYNQAPEGFRPDIFSNPTKGTRPVKRHDLQQTVFRMLVDNSHFFDYFHSLSRCCDPINDPFRKLSQRVDLVLQHLDAPHEADATVEWAARHIAGCVRQIHSHVFSRDNPLTPGEADSAASALVHILASIIDHHAPTEKGRPGRRPAPSRSHGSLYHRLIGDRDNDFILATLESIPEAASPFLHSLEELLDRSSTYGVPATYVEKFRALFGRLRKSRTGAGLKRRSHDGGGTRSKRRA